MDIKQSEQEVEHMCIAMENEWNAGMKAGRLKGRQEGRQEGMKLGIISAMCDMVRDGLLSISAAAQRAGLSTEEFSAEFRKRYPTQ